MASSTSSATVSSSSQTCNPPPLPTSGISLSAIEGRGDSRVVQPNSTGDMLHLPNNAVLDLDNYPGKDDIKIFSPALGYDDSTLLESTNSSFTKISEIITYSWPPDLKGNVIATHRTLPLIAYVINTGYHKSQGSRAVAVCKPEDQMVRLVNSVNSGIRALSKPRHIDFIVDIAFAFDNSRRSANLIATVDRSSTINIFKFDEVGLTSPSGTSLNLSLDMILAIRPPNNIIIDTRGGIFRLAWCPYIPAPDEAPFVDPSYRLAVSSGKHLEVFTFNDFHFQNNETVDRDHFKSMLGEYYCITDVHSENIVSVAIANEGSLICTASSDNTVTFFQEEVSDLRPSFNYVKTWKPDLEKGEKLSELTFLDDYDFLLNHPDHSFWGFLTIGTNNGLIYLFDLQGKEWKCIQRVKITHKDESTEPFTYRVDKSSKVIVAKKEATVFLLMIDYRNEDKFLSSEEEDDNTIRVVRRPILKQLARFQLYNPLVSYQAGKSTDSDVELYWITLRTLEKCIITYNSLAECVIQPTYVGDNPKVRKVHAVTPSPSKPEVRPVVIPSPALVTPPRVESKEQELINKIQQNAIDIDKLKQKDRRRSDQMTTPTQNPQGRPSILDKLNNIPAQSPQTIQKSSPAVPAYAPPPVHAMPPALNDMAKVMLLEGQINQLRQQVLPKLDHIQESFGRVFSEIQSEFAQMKVHSTELQQQQVQQYQKIQQQADSQKSFKMATEKTINLIVEKSMEQLNDVLQAGLKDFFGQVDTGIGELTATVKNQCNILEAQMKDTNEKLSAVQNQLDIFQKQLETNEAEQQLLLYRFQQLSSNTQNIFG